jgi:hypothetical protein
MVSLTADCEKCYILVMRDAAPESKSIGSSLSSRSREAKSPPLGFPVGAATSPSSSSLSPSSLSLLYNTSSNVSPVVVLFGCSYRRVA